MIQCADRRCAEASRWTRSFIALSSFRLVVERAGIASIPRCYLMSLYHGGFRGGPGRTGPASSLFAAVPGTHGLRGPCARRATIEGESRAALLFPAGRMELA